MAVKCKFCQNTVDDTDTPCSNPSEAMMRCEINNAPSNGIVTHQQVSPKNREVDPYDILSDITSIDYISHEPQSRFHFDPHMFALLKEAEKELKAITEVPLTIDQIWKKAQEIAPNYDVVMEPVLKKKK